MCVRGCKHWRRHLNSCAVEDRSAGAWIPWQPDPRLAEAVMGGFSDPVVEYRQVLIERLCNADYRPRAASHGAWTSHTGSPESIHVTERGTLEIWFECSGCTPRKAVHGSLCEQCHTRMALWLGRSGVRGGVAWAHRWISADLLPSQNAAQTDKITRGKPAPPAPLATHVYVLMEDIRKALGTWLRSTTQEFDLVGPDWWSHRVDHRPDDESSWRFWLPQDQFEVNSAADYLGTWLDRIEAVPDLVAMMYQEADLLLRRVSQLAPWEPKRQRLPGLKCPECEREALTRADGDEHLSCRRCGGIVSRAKYDRWSFLITAEKEAVS